MKILLIGAGSIGKRHLQNLLSLGYTDVCVITRSGLPVELSCFKIFRNFEEAFNGQSYDTAFICTPTSHHISNFLELLHQKVENIYVEKPVSHNGESIQAALQLAASYKNNIVVGYDLHFDPGLQKVRELLQQNTIGKIVSVNAFVGQYLPQWRPYEDHRMGTSARAETGGGVLLDLVHEFDYLYWLTGKVDAVTGWHSNSGALEIETEETADVLLKFANGAIGSVHLDYLQQSLIRYCIFTGTKGTITCNLADKTVRWITESKKASAFDYSAFERNDRFKEIIRAFLENNKDDRLTTLPGALQSLKIVLAAKYASTHNCTVDLVNFKFY